MVYNLASNNMERQAILRLMHLHHTRKATKNFLPIATKHIRLVSQKD